MSKIGDILIKFFNFINPFSKKLTIHIVGQTMNVYHSDVSLTHIPKVDEEIFFEENGELYDVVRVLHFYRMHRQIVYVIISPVDNKEVKIEFELND